MNVRLNIFSLSFCPSEEYYQRWLKGLNFDDIHDPLWYYIRALKIFILVLRNQVVVVLQKTSSVLPILDIINFFF